MRCLLVYCMRVEENKECFHSVYLLDQIPALVWMNSMLVLPEQAADVDNPSLWTGCLFCFLFCFFSVFHRPQIGVSGKIRATFKFYFKLLLLL